MTKYQSVLNLIGRIAIAALFLPAGLQKLMEIEGTTAYFGSLGLPAFTLLVWMHVRVIRNNKLTVLMEIKNHLRVVFYLWELKLLKPLRPQVSPSLAEFVTLDSYLNSWHPIARYPRLSRPAY